VQVYVSFNRSYRAPARQPLRHRSRILLDPTHYDVYAAVHTLFAEETRSTGKKRGYVTVPFHHTFDNHCAILHGYDVRVHAMVFDDPYASFHL